MVKTKKITVTPDPIIEVSQVRGYRAAVLAAGDVSGGGTTQEVGFQIKDTDGNDVALEVVLEFAVFDDINFSIPAVSAILGTVVNGTIIAGEGTAALKVKTDATGLFKCTLTDVVDETVYCGCSMTFGSVVVSCFDIDSVTFST